MASKSLDFLFDPDWDPENLPLASDVADDNSSEKLNEDGTVQEPEECENSSVDEEMALNSDQDELPSDETLAAVETNSLNRSRKKQVAKELFESESSDESLSSDEEMDHFGCDSSESDNEDMEREDESNDFYRMLFSSDKEEPLKELSEENVKNCSVTSFGPPLASSTQVSLMSQSKVTGMSSKTRQIHPAGWSMPKKRRISETPSIFDSTSVPNYRSTIQRTNYIRECQTLAFLMGTSKDLPESEIPDDVEPTEEEKEIVNQLKQMIEKGDVDSWEKLVGQMYRVRKQYAKKDDAAYFHDRSRVLPRLKAIYDSLATRPAPNDYVSTPKRMTKELKQHQQSGLKFMLWRETQDPFGGILAGIRILKIIFDLFIN